MKTEDFDDAIRRKVESINYLFSTEDIDRVQKYTNRKNSSQLFWNQYGSFSVFCLFGFIMAGLLYSNYNQSQKQTLLLAKIDSLQRGFVQLGQYNNSIKGNDTVFIVKYVSGKEYSQLAEKNSKLTENKKTIMKEKDFFAIHNYKKRINNHSENFIDDNTYSKTNTNQISYYKNKNNSQENFEIRETSRKHTIIDSNISESDLISNDIYQTAKVINNSLKEEESSFKERASLKDVKRTSTVDSPVATNVDSLIKIVKETTRPKDSTKIKKHKNYLSIKNLNYLAGLGIEKSNSQFGIGILGELSFSKRFSMNAGFKYLNISTHFHDTDDFNKQTNKNFYSATSQLMDTFNITDISMNYTVLQIPVALNYYVPLKNSFSILVSAGTDLDIYASLNVKYQQVGNYSKDIEKRTNLKIQYHPILFNNIVLSTGIQKKWHQFVLQASPFVSPQLKVVDYKQGNLYGGLRLRVLYTF